MLYHVSGHLINKLAMGDIISPTQANPLIQKMRKIITKFNGGDPRKLSNQLLFQVQLLYAQMLSGSMTQKSAIGVELLSMVSEIYTYVISSQVKYCKMDMKHPFLEQTYLNIAIFNRSMKKFADSLQMWKLLEGLQRELYGDDSYTLLFTYKNIGTCFLGVGNSDKAREYFELCIELLDKCKTNKPDIIKKDKDELSSLHQNMYLTYVSERNYQSALESAEKVIALMSELYGERAKRLSSKYY
jgi:tetratricopeptide (TPR) repeat protein